jgi:hypothetical protein
VQASSSLAELLLSCVHLELTSWRLFVPCPEDLEVVTGSLEASKNTLITEELK